MQTSTPGPQAVANQDKGPALAHVASRGAVDEDNCPGGQNSELRKFGEGSLKRLPTMWENPIQSLGQEDLLQKEMATHSSILAWKIPWTEEPGRLQSMGSRRVGYN